MSRFQSVRNALFATLTAAVLAAPAVQAGEKEEMNRAIEESMAASINEMRESVQTEVDFSVRQQLILSLHPAPEARSAPMVAEIDNEEATLAGQPQ